MTMVALRSAAVTGARRGGRCLGHTIPARRLRGRHRRARTAGRHGAGNGESDQGPADVMTMHGPSAP